MARPREFDPADALDSVMDVFWRQGYEGTSMFDIEATTGLNKQSLYRLFGDKRGMYLAALKRYEETEVEEATALLRASGDAKKKFKRLFDAVLAPALSNGDRRGCFLCNASIDQAQLDEETRAFVSASINSVREGFEDALRASPPYDDDKRARAVMATQLMAGYFGLRVLVRANAEAEILKRAASGILSAI